MSPYIVASRRTHSVWPVLAAALLTSGLAACASAPAPVVLTLPTAPVPAAMPGVASAAGSAASAPVLAVRRVNVPEYLVTRRVRYRADPSTLAEWPNTFWGERIEIGVSREFVAALRQQLPAWTLCDTQCGDQLPALSLQVDLSPMDYLRAAKSLESRARITLTSGGAIGRVLLTEERAYEVAASADTPQAQAQAIDDLLRLVARDTAPMVMSLPASLPPQTQERTR